jgi:hypothetical protein
MSNGQTPQATLDGLIRRNAMIIGGWVDHTTNPPTLHVLYDHHHPIAPHTMPTTYRGHPVAWHPTTPFHIRHAPASYPAPRARTACYDEPVPGGCQIQPQGANWVGTLGTACHFADTAGDRRWGILSCWHVLKMDVTTPDCPICQPLDTMPAIAHNTRWRDVSPATDNQFDAALANAMINGLHTIGPELYELGPVGPQPATPSVGLAVCKSGRTTALTHGQVTACGVTVQVDYGNFVATLVNQCLIEGDGSAFSAPGDSGSLVVSCAARAPVGLLFAGNDTLTVINPIGPIVDAFGVGFDFP